MANALRVLAYLPKNPFESVARSRCQSEIEAVVKALKAEGHSAKMTRLKVGPKGPKGWFEYIAWKRPQEG